MSRKFETDSRAFIRFWLVPLGIMAVIFFLYKALTGLIIIGISLLLALALKPLVGKVDGFFNRRLKTEKKHRTISAVMAYLIVVLVIGGILAIVGPVVVNETSRFIEQLPTTFENGLGGWDGINNFGRSIGINNLQNEITRTLETLSESIFGSIGTNFVASVSGAADIIMKIVLVLVLTLLFLLEGPGLINILWKSLSEGNENKKPVEVGKKIVGRMANVVSVYFSNQVIVALIDGLASGLIIFVLSLILDISSTLAIPMGLMTMIFYLIPMFGQFIGGALVTLVLLFSNPLAALIFAIIYIIYAQIENNLIAPKVQGNSLGLPAVVILCAITIGMYMFGLLGAIITIPIAGCIKVLIEEYPNIKIAARD